MHHGMPQGPFGPDGRPEAHGDGIPAFRARQRDGGSGGGGGSGDPYEHDDDGGSDPDAIDVSEIRGVERARGRLLPWFRKIVDSVEEEQNPLHVVLAQVTSQAGAQEVTGVSHDLESPPDDTINQLLMIAAEDMCEAEFSGSKISYSILVRLQNGTTERQTFVLELPRPKNASALTHPPQRQHFPDAAGVIGMFMNQNLQVTQFALEGANTGKDVLLRMIDRLEEENRYLKRTQFARDREMQILLDGNLQRQFLVDEHRAKVERDAKIGDGFKALAPQLLQLALPPNMAQSLQAIASPMAGAQGQLQGAPHPGGGAEGDMTSTAGIPVSNDAAIVDELIREFEEDQPFFIKLFGLMGEKPRCAQLLGMLYEASNVRRQTRARAQAEESARRTHNE